MIKQHPLLVEGIEAAKAGDKAKARRLLTQAVRRNPDSAEAWLWLSGALDTPQGRAFCLEKVLSIDPANRSAQRGLAALGTAQVPLAVSGIRPAQPPLAPQVPAAEIVPQTAIAPPQGEEGVTAIPMPVTRPAKARRLSQLWSRLKASSAGRWTRLWARPVLPRRLTRLWSQPRFWRAVVICLGAIALALAGILAYDAIKRPAGDESCSGRTAGHGGIAPPTAHDAPHFYVYTPADRHALSHRHSHTTSNADLDGHTHTQPNTHRHPDPDSFAHPPQCGARRAPPLLRQRHGPPCRRWFGTPG